MVINKKLNCGVRMIMEQIPYVRSVSIGIWVKSGSVDETEKNAGISHFIEHMMFKGTENRTAKQIASDVDKIGGNINAFTGKESTCYYLKTLDSNVEKGCEILLDMLLHSTYDKEEMEKEKMVICEEMKMIEDSADEYALDLIGEAIFQGTALESQIIGTKESLMATSRDDILEYLAKQYTSDSVVISIAGNFQEEQVCDYFEKHLTGLNGTKKQRLWTPCAHKPVYISKVKDVEQSHICFGMKGVPMESEDYYAWILLNNIMGGTMSSRLFQNIREEKGLAYSVFSSASAYVNDGSYMIYAGVAQDKTEAAISAIGEELQILKEHGVTAEELSIAKEQIKSNYIFGLESVNSRMFSIGKSTLLLDRVRSQEEIVTAVDAVTMKDIEGVAQKICNLEQYSGVHVGKRELNLKDILSK